MRRLAPAVGALALLAAGCGSHADNLVGMSAQRAACELARQGTPYRLGGGPVLQPSEELACRPVEGPQPEVTAVKRLKKLVVLAVRCEPTVGC